MDGFRWHPEARLFDAGGGPLALTARTAGVVGARPAGQAILAAFGGAFRIGEPTAAPPPDGFETLTSGSTGAPRRIARGFASWRASFAVNAGLFGIGPGVRVAVLGRLDQSLSLYGAVEGLCLGAEVHVLDGLRPDRQRAALAARRVQVLWAGPSQMHLLLEAGGPPLPDLRWLLLGGAKLAPGLRAALADICPNAALREFYGAAEASFITLADATTPPHSVGRAYPGVRISLRELTGTGGPGLVAKGSAGAGLVGAGLDGGRVWVQSPYLFTRYAGADPGTAEWQGDWLGLGEVARFEGDWLVLLGRIDRMVTVAGQNVFPEALEAFMAGLAGVRRVAVLARPDAMRGQVLTAVAMGEAAQEAAILAAARAKFGVLAAPRGMHWRADWPLLASGKPDLAALAADLPDPGAGS